MSCFLRFVLREGETSSERHRKTVLLNITVPVLALAVVAPMVAQAPKFRLNLFLIACGILIATCMAILVYMVSTRSAPGTLVEILAIGVTAGSLAYDWRSASRLGTARTWPLCVLVMDVLLLTDARPRTTTAVQVVVTTWLAVLAVEEGIRFGMFDMSIVDRDDHDAYYRCEFPPCASGMGLALIRMCLVCIVFHVDFVLTRHFARKMRQEQDAIRASVETAETIAKHLARFDLEAAAMAIETARDLPRELEMALLSVLNNLRSYRPYLPAACFVQHMEAEDKDTASLVPEASDDQEKGEVSMCSTLHDSTLHTPRSVRVVPIWIAPGNSSSHLIEDRRVSLLAINMKGLHDIVSVRRVEAASAFVGKVVEVTRMSKGLIDCFNGDRVLVSFNAALRNLRHPQSALQCGLQLQNARVGNVTLAAASGMALCADVGSSEFRRYCVLGAVASRVHLMERLHRMWGLPGVLCDNAIEEDANCHYDICPLPGKVRFEKESSPTHLWLALQERLHATCVEWMYQLDSERGSSFAPYVGCVKLYNEGRLRDAADEAADIDCTAGETLDKLLQFLRRVIGHLLNSTHRRPSSIPYTQITGAGLYDAPHFSASILLQEPCATDPDLNGAPSVPP